MRNYSKLSPFFWLKGSGKRLRGDAIAQVVAGYISTGPDANMVGIFFLSLATIATHTGHSLEDVRSALQRISAAGYAHYDFDAELVWIPNHAFFEIGESMKKADKRRGKVLAELSQVRGHRFVDDFRRIYGLAYGISANDSEGHLPTSEGASAIEGQDKHRTNTGQDQDQGKGPSGPPLGSGRQFDSGTAASEEARQAFERGVSSATGAPFGLIRASFHDRDLCQALNKHAPAELTTKLDILRWLETIIAVWVKSAEPQTITPSKLLDWLNNGRKPARGRGPGGGPRGDRQGLGGWTPPATGTDDPFGGDS